MRQSRLAGDFSCAVGELAGDFSCAGGGDSVGAAQQWEGVHHTGYTDTSVMGVEMKPPHVVQPPLAVHSSPESKSILDLHDLHVAVVAPGRRETLLRLLSGSGGLANVPFFSFRREA